MANKIALRFIAW